VTFRPEQREWKEQARPAPVAPTSDAARAARRLMSDDGFNIGVLFEGDRPVCPIGPVAPTCTTDDLEQEFTL
jgi:2-oxoglutarate/2-oxoacid ferredoxin oxidoreductase subunit beta